MARSITDNRELQKSAQVRISHGQPNEQCGGLAKSIQLRDVRPVIRISVEGVVALLREGHQAVLHTRIPGPILGQETVRVIDSKFISSCVA